MTQQEASKTMDHFTLVHMIRRALGPTATTDEAWGMVEILSERGHVKCLDPQARFYRWAYPGLEEWKRCRALMQAGEWE